MCYYGNGYGFSEIYAMPIHIRRFHYNKLIEYKKAEKKENGSGTKPPTPKTKVRK